MADAAAASNPWLPAASSSLWYTTASAEGVSPSSRARTALVLADSRSSSVKPPAWRGSPARGANGTAASRTAAQAAITHHRRRYTNAPSRSNGVTGATGGLRRRKCMRTRQGPSYRLARSGRRHPIDPSLARHGRQRSSGQDGQYCGDHVVIAPGRAARAGLLAASVTLLVLLLAPLVLNADGFLEAVHNGVTKYFPTGLLDLGIGTFGPYAKGLLFVGVCAGVLGAGALTGWLLARYAGLGMGGPIYETVFVSGLTFLLAEVVVL